jgi:hypothetical protein
MSLVEQIPPAAQSDELYVLMWLPEKLANVRPYILQIPQGKIVQIAEIR